MKLIKEIIITACRFICSHSRHTWATVNERITLGVYPYKTLPQMA